MLDGDFRRLPLAEPGEFVNFGWRLAHLATKEEIKQHGGFRNYSQLFPSEGGSDLRIHHRSDGCLVFYPNLGSFSGMEEEWKWAIGDITYPIMVRDERTDFEYSNPAYQEFQQALNR